MNPFLVTHSSNKIYLRTCFVITTFNSFPKPLEAIYLYTICKECVRELNSYDALSLIVGQIPSCVFVVIVLCLFVCYCTKKTGFS